VLRQFRQTAEGHMLLAEPDASGAALLAKRATAFADRIEAEPALIGSLIASGTLAQGQMKLQLDEAAA
jgi:hypothetical protein